MEAWGCISKRPPHETTTPLTHSVDILWNGTTCQHGRLMPGASIQCYGHLEQC